MGKRGREVVGLDIDELISTLNRAYADEWLAYYQYWVGAKVVKGTMRGALEPELIEHAADELRHAGLVADRIIQLGGTPVLIPEDWHKHCNCAYDAPLDPAVEAILEQNINAERCAIDVYQKIIKLTKDKDPVTYNIALEILTDEVEHEEDLEAVRDDIEEMKAQWAKGM